jgi:small subunit ribosomal protein S8
MSMTDPIADLLTRLRNAHRAKHRSVSAPYSKMKAELVRILMDEGYVSSYRVDAQAPGATIQVELKYAKDGRPAISGVERVSRPGRRVYCGKAATPRVLGGLGVVILSTPKGLMTGSASTRQGVGGEVICSVW